MPWSAKPGPEPPRHRGRRVAAAASAWLAIAVFAGDAHAADDPAGLGIKLPSVEVKLDPVVVKVPSVEVNLSPVQVQVPSVEVKLPPVDVKLPPVEATVPPLDVKVPPAEAPAPVRTPAPTAQQAPPGGGAAPATGQEARARETSAAGAPGPATSGEAPARGGTAPGGSPARREPTTGTRGDPGVDHAVPPPVRRRERRLRELVRSLSGCLGALRTIQTRVLTLRADGATRRQVARRLDLGVPRVAAVERRGLDRLREHARAGGCHDAPAPAVALTSAESGTAAPSTMPAASRRPRGEVHVRAGVAEGVDRSLGSEPRQTVTPAVVLRKAGPPLLLLLIGGFAVGFALNWFRETRGGAHRPAPS